MARRLLVLCLMFLVLCASQGVKKAEGRVCQSQSHYFKGPCLQDHNCAYVCRNEGFSGGRCRGIRRRCFCTKLC